MQLQRINRDWYGTVIVAATGPSLTPDVAARIRKARWPQEKCRIVAVNDAFKLLPYADVLYACDLRWWQVNIAEIDQKFFGERWTTHEGKPGESNDKSVMPAEWNVRMVAGTAGEVFSTRPDRLIYGSNSGFQAVNFALLKGAEKIVLIGFDMRVVNGQRHFFGDHPEPLHNRTDYDGFIRPFRTAARSCAVPIVNATPGSALDAFPKVDLEQALADEVQERKHVG